MTDESLPTEVVEQTTAPVAPVAPVTPAPAPEQTPAPEAAPVLQEYKMPDEMFFKGEAVEVTVPDDVALEVQQAGGDLSAIVGELFAKDSDFTLSDATRAPLDAKYGKTIVNSYLNALKAQNEHSVSSFKNEQATIEGKQAELDSWTYETVGGEDEWNQMAAWAGDNLNDEDYEGFNAAMQSGNKYTQRLALQHLKAAFRNEVGDGHYELIPADSSAPAGSTGGALNATDYMAEIGKLGKLPAGERKQAMQILDQRRRAGMQRGL